jgi:hypothetical protein
MDAEEFETAWFAWIHIAVGVLTVVTMVGTELLARFAFASPTAPTGGNITNLINFKSLNIVFAVALMIKIMVIGLKVFKLDTGITASAGVVILLATNRCAHTHLQHRARCWLTARGANPRPGPRCCWGGTVHPSPAVSMIQLEREQRLQPAPSAKVSQL